MKAILVFDIPTVDSLEGLVADIEIKRWIQWGEDKEVCFIGNQQLKPMPRKLTEADISWGEQRGYRGGWNNCLAEITGETDE